MTRMTNTIATQIANSVMEEVPKEDFMKGLKRLGEEQLFSRLPPEIKKLAGKPELLPFLMQHSTTIYDDEDRTNNITLQYQGDSRISGTSEIREKLGEGLHDRIKAALAKTRYQKEKRRELFRVIEKNARSCSTVDKFRKAFPEIAHHAPDGAVENLPAAAVMTTLKEAGYPKSKA